jgi:hypothetical protein
VSVSGLAIAVVWLCLHQKMSYNNNAELQPRHCGDSKTPCNRKPGNDFYSYLFIQLLLLLGGSCWKVVV